jgi:response regulator RpfG family c-di-GMP phosphodiesterase
MDSKQLKILIADDESDECNFFKKTIKRLMPSATFDIVHNGEQLMKYLLLNIECLPDILFLDLIMPRKNGFECLSEINRNDAMKEIFVVICSDSYPHDPYYQRKMLNMLQKCGANLFIHKSADYDKLKHDICLAINKVTDNLLLKEPVKNPQIKILNQ